MPDRRPFTAAAAMADAARPAPLTAAALRERIAARADLREDQRRARLSAVNTLARVAGLPADLVMLTPQALRRSFLERSAAACGLSRGSKANVTSLLRAALADAGVIDAESTPPPADPVAADWANAMVRLPPRGGIGLTRLCRFCAARGIAPAGVTEATFTAFRDYVTTRTLVGNVREACKTARRAWNRACRAGTGWPGQELTRRRRRHDYILPLSAFPPAFQADLAAFGKRLAATAFDDPFSDLQDAAGEAATVPPRPLKPKSVALRQDHCRWAASAVVASGVPITEITSLASLVTPLERAGNALRFVYRHAGAKAAAADPDSKAPDTQGQGKASAAGMHIAEALMMIARHVARLPQPDIDRLRKWGRTMRLDYRGMTEKNQRSMAEALDPAHDAALLALPQALLEAAYAMLPHNPVKAARLAMRAVSIALLLRVPLRLGNVHAQRLDRHLLRPGRGRAGFSAIHVPAAETKTPEPIDMWVSPALSDMLTAWTRDFRPIVAQPGCVWLFPGQAGAEAPITPQAFRDAVADTTEEWVGVRLTPHQFRHLAAHRCLAAREGEYETVRQLLGHATIETARRSYASTDQIAAVRRFDEVLNGKQRSGGPGRSRAVPPATAGGKPRYCGGRRTGH